MKTILLIAACAVAAGCATAPKAVETVSNPAPSTAASPSASPISQSQAPKPLEKPWRNDLPVEDQVLRNRLNADPFVEGWLQTQDTWVGYESPETLKSKGFFINAGLNHNGNGQSPSGVEKGSCSLLRQDGIVPAMICGRSAMTWQWGIQSEEAREKIFALMNPPEPIRPVSTSQSIEDSEFNAEIADPPSNCREGAGKEFTVVTTFPSGVVAVDVANSRQNGGNWYREVHNNCWIHESQLQWIESTTREQPVETSQTTSTYSSSGISSSSGARQCVSSSDVDSRGRRCGGRAASSRRKRR
jgi:hypothetical protein